MPVSALFKSKVPSEWSGIYRHRCTARIEPEGESPIGDLEREPGTSQRKAGIQKG